MQDRIKTSVAQLLDVPKPRLSEQGRCAVLKVRILLEQVYAVKTKAGKVQRSVWNRHEKLPFKLRKMIQTYLPKIY